MTENEQTDTSAGLPCFVRWCKSFTTLNGLKTLITVDEETADLKTSLAKEVFNELDLDEPKNGEMSVYRADTRQSTSIGHAMAVIAVAIGGDDFRSTNSDGTERDIKTKHTKKVVNREGATLLLDCKRTQDKLNVDKTPHGCKTIWVAAAYHHDIRYDDATALAAAIDFVRGELQQPESLLAVCPSSPQPFNRQAQVVLQQSKSYLNNDGAGWADTSFTVSEQVARLRRLAALIDFDLAT